jgi:hypothetical protein
MLTSTSVVGRVVTGIALFLLLSAPLARVSDPQSRAEKKIEQDAERPRLAVFGDSRAHRGVNPTLMRRVFAEAGVAEVTGHNFAQNGTDAVHHYNLIVGSLLDKPGPPTVIVWSPNPLSFDDSRTANQLEQVKAKNLGAMFTAGAPLEPLLDVATMAVYPPYRHRLPIMAGIEGRAETAGKKLAPLQAAALGLSLPDEPERRKYIEYPDGYSPFRVLALWEDSFAQSFRDYSGKYEALVRSEWRYRLARRMMQKIREAGCLLVVVELPVAPSYTRALASSDKHKAFREELSRMAQEEGAIFLSHAERFQDDHAFGDPAHMVEATADEYSAFLAKALLAEPSVLRMLSLSPSR